MKRNLKVTQPCLQLPSEFSLNSKISIRGSVSHTIFNGNVLKGSFLRVLQHVPSPLLSCLHVYLCPIAQKAALCMWRVFQMKTRMPLLSFLA